MPEFENTRRCVIPALAAMFAVVLLLPAVPPVSAAPDSLVRLDGSQRGEVTSGAFRLDSPMEVRLQVTGAWLGERPVTECWMLDAVTREKIWSLDREQCVQKGSRRP